MKIIDLKNENSDIKESYIALGNFDGLHLAHMKIINNLIEQSKKDNIQSSILLFENHTLVSLSDKKHKILTSLEQKIDILKSTEIDNIYIVDFNTIKNLDPNVFLNEFLKSKLKISGIFIGFDYRYGKGAKGSLNFLKSFTDKNNIYLNVEEPVKSKEETISSTIIKSKIEKNNIFKAEELLGRKYYIEGKIVQGKQLGTKLGFPTANIEMTQNYVLHTEGVYYTEILIDEKIYKAATSLGINYTFNEDEVKIEAHILDFNRNIYGEFVQLRFIEKIREMEKFNKLSDLINQVKTDIKVIENKGII